MSYGGIGLSSVRGSATSGYVSRNLSHVKPEFFRKKIENNTSGKKNHEISSSSTLHPFEKKNEDIVEHNRKRALESQVYELEENLKEKGCNEKEISRRVTELRDRFTKRRSNDGRGQELLSSSKRSVDSHTLSLAKEQENKRAARAFGIDRDNTEPKRRDDERRRYRDTNDNSSSADRRHRDRSRSRSRDRGRGRGRGDKSRDENRRERSREPDRGANDEER